MRNPQLDILRALAVVLVIFRHKHAILNLPSFMERLALFGWTGVDLFFVLSGFLIAGLLFTEYAAAHAVNVKRFLIRRSFKIYPAFYSLLLLEVLLMLKGNRPLNFQAMYLDLTENHVLEWDKILAEVFFVQNYLPGLTVNGHTWSLAVEEHFYFLVSGVFLILPFINKKFSFTKVTLAVSFFCLAVRTYISLTSPYNGRTHGYPTHLRIDSLLFGVWLAYVFHFKPRWKEWMTRHSFTLFVFGLIAISPAFFIDFGDPLMTSIGFTLMYLGFGGILVFALTRKMPGRGLTNTLLMFLAYIGKHSYSIYLWHFFSRDRVLALLVNKGIIRFTSDMSEFLWYLFMALAFGILMAKLIEFPFLRLRERCFPYKS